MLNQSELTIADAAAIKADLQYMTARWHELPMPCVFEVRAFKEGAQPQTFKFAPDWIDEAVDAIVNMNNLGYNIYAVRNPIRHDVKGSASDADIVAAFFLWADCDDPAAAGNVYRFDGPKWSAAVTTGRVPSVRVHTYWALKDACLDLAEWRAMQITIAQHFASDGSVINPSRIMRVGGTVSYPDKRKQGRGYVKEVTTIRTEYDDAREPVTLEQMARVFGERAPARQSLSQAATAKAPRAAVSYAGNVSGNGLSIDTGPRGGKSSEEYADILRRARTDGEKHGGVRDLSAHLAGSGVSRTMAEAIIRDACPVWDEGVEKLIDSAYAKFAPVQEVAPQVQAMQQQAEEAEAAAWPTLYDFFDEAALEPRQWVYGKHYLRRFVSVLASAGGIGKTSMQIVEALAICTGKPLLGEEVKEQCNVWIINLEDPMDEMQRRILAAMRHYGITPDEVRGKLFVDAGRDFALTFAVQTREGVTPNVALVDHLIKRIPELQIGAVFIDPFVGAHQINENDNMAVNAVVGQIRKVADETNCAIGLVHHIRKGNGEDATIDSVRGAGSLIGAARAARVINKVSEQDALSLGVDPKEALGLFRVDDGKANLAPPASAAVFRRMEGVQIANGEWVGVAIPFALPDEWEGLGEDTVNDILSIIGRGIPDPEGNEEYYSARPQDKDRWAGNVITQYAFDNAEHAKNAAQAKRILSMWFKSGLLEEQSYHSVKQRKERKGVFVKSRVGEQK